MSQEPPATAATSETTGFKVWRPGLTPYRDALLYQQQQLERRRQQSFDLLILLQHPPVITLGRSTNPEHLLYDNKTLESQGIECVRIGRGGDVTLHNPGQLVGYPIIDLRPLHKDLHRFLRLLEMVLIDTLADYGLTGESKPGKTGVWINERKIASIGIAVRHWISYHGFALNVDNDLTLFDTIVPCGLADVTMTSMSRELGRSINKEEVSEQLICHFGTRLQSVFLGDHDQATTTQT